MNHRRFMDRQIAPLNPCSVETIPEPIRLADGRMVWPWMLSCYELDETSGKRFGQIELGVIDVPDIANHSNAMPLKFDKTERAMKETGKIQLLDLSERRSGVLDGKWSAMPPPSTNDLTEENVQSTSSCTGWCFASAHSTGEIRIHSVQLNNTTGSQDFDNAHDRNPLSSPEPLFSVNFLGQSEIMHTMSTEESSKLCLSLCWNNPAAYKQNHEQPTPNQSHPQLVSTYSNGRIAIHDVVFASDNSSVHMIEREAWLAHTMFSTTPSEVWSSCFAAGEQQLILSGGDDGKLKIWDVRATGRPIQVLDELFTSGVTCLSPHPVQEHIIAAGSYDESVCLLDTRYLSERKPLCRSSNLGGGVWRIKWHPYTPNRILIAAMHAGCRVVNFNGGSCFENSDLSEDSLDGIACVTDCCTKSFTEHESMAYGADWLVCPHPTQNGYYEAAVSCSFYDRAVYLWDSVH